MLGPGVCQAVHHAHRGEPRRRSIGQLDNRGHDRAQFRRPAASKSCNMEILALPSCLAISMRCKALTGITISSACATAIPSSSIGTSTATKPGSLQIWSIRAPVRAATGLNDRLPISLVQTSVRISALATASSPARCKIPARSRTRAVSGCSRRLSISPINSRLPPVWWISPGRAYLACKVHHAAQHVTRSERRHQFAARIDGLDKSSVKAAAFVREVPPWQTIDGWHHHGLVMHERRSFGTSCSSPLVLLARKMASWVPTRSASADASASASRRYWVRLPASR